MTAKSAKQSFDQEVSRSPLKAANFKFFLDRQPNFKEPYQKRIKKSENRQALAWRFFVSDQSVKVVSRAGFEPATH
ncbi:MAG: hypothetical protein AAGA74_20650 [Pseudomonadota bacterium]